MKVLAEEPWGWFLIEDMGRLYLNVLVEHGAISYDITAELNAREAQDYVRNGAPFLMQMASAMRNQAMAKEWRPTALPTDWSQRSTEAVHEWQKTAP